MRATRMVLGTLLVAGGVGYWKLRSSAPETGATPALERNVAAPKAEQPLIPAPTVPREAGPPAPAAAEQRARELLRQLSEARSAQDAQRLSLLESTLRQEVWDTVAARRYAVQSGMVLAQQAQALSGAARVEAQDRARRLISRGVFLANLVASLSSLAMLTPVIVSRLAIPDRARLKEMLGFGAPLILAGMGSMIVQVADRPILAKMTGLAAAGIYGTCYKLGIGMMLLVGMFDQAWKPFILERADRPDAGAIIARVLTYFTALAAWALLAIVFFIGPLVTAPLFGGKPLIHPSFWSGLPVVPIVTLGYLFNGLYFVMLAPLMLDKRTGAVSAATWAGALVNILLNALLIPRLGMMGAAWATLAAYAVMAAAVWALGRASRPVPYEWTRLAVLAGWTAALWWPGMSAGLPARFLLLAAYPVGLLASGFLNVDELAELRSLLSARRA